MASGCPVINTAIPHSGVPWVSPHERDGPDGAGGRPGGPGRRGQPAAWTSRACATAWPPAAAARAAEEFDHRVMADRSLAIYRRVLDGGVLPQPSGQSVLA